MTATAEAPVKLYTVEEYFKLEKTSKIKHEFVNGKLIAKLLPKILEKPTVK